METYWELLKKCAVLQPCRAYLAGPFQADELALRFVMQKMGFELVDGPDAGQAGLVIQGKGNATLVPDAPLVLEESRVAPPLLELAGRQFHLLGNGPAASLRQANIARLLSHPESLELALELIGAGGMSNLLLEAFLLGWRIATREGLSRFSACAASWLPAPFARMMSRPESDYYLGAVQARFHGFSAYRFCMAAKSEGLPVFSSEPHLSGLYAPEHAQQARAWLYYARKQPVVLSEHTLKLLEHTPVESREENPQGYLWLGPIEDIELLEKTLSRQPGLLQDIRKLHIEAWRPGLLAALAPHIRPLAQLDIRCQEGFFADELRNFLGEVPAYRLGIHADKEKIKVGISIEQWASGWRHAPLLEHLHLSGFRPLQLQGLGLFTGLSRLFLPDNQLSSLPETIGQLPLLRELSLDQNPVSNLPDSFFRLRLSKLQLSLDKLSPTSRYRVETAFSPAVLQRPFTL